MNKKKHLIIAVSFFCLIFFYVGIKCYQYKIRFNLLSSYVFVDLTRAVEQYNNNFDRYPEDIKSFNVFLNENEAFEYLLEMLNLVDYRLYNNDSLLCIYSTGFNRKDDSISCVYNINNVSCIEGTYKKGDIILYEKLIHHNKISDTKTEVNIDAYEEMPPPPPSEIGDSLYFPAPQGL